MDVRALSSEEGAGALTADLVRRAAQTLHGSEDEGFVICDAEYRRVKVKCPSYVNAAWKFPLTRPEGISDKDLLQIVQAGETAEFAIYRPDMQERLSRVDKRYASMLADMQTCYDELSMVTTQKEFALLAKQQWCQAGLFSMRTRNISAAEWAQDAPSKTIERLLFTLHAGVADG